jgi:bifunctional UDP-N-acetylglucosamine pyrophosphorylase/glucosamine-1-phosphate N-acetyltransferase
LGKNKISTLATIDENSIVKGSEIRAGALVEQSYIEDSFVDENTKIGPFAHLRPNSHIGKNCRIGNFCEIKNSTIGDGTKVSHLAYVGDAVVGKNCNIGCGVIFVNYNGREKHKIEIGDNVFVGSNCNLIAPLKIESNVYVCAGTTVTENLHADDFVIGRARQTVKKNRANQYLKKPD